MTDTVFEAVTVAGAPELDGFWKAPAGFDRVLAACSATGPLAYIEADYFGGTGTQTAQVWDAGKVVLGPLHLAGGEPLPTTGSPISQAKRRLGVTKGNHFDEFDAVGLGRHRDTGDGPLRCSPGCEQSCRGLVVERLQVTHRPMTTTSTSWATRMTWTASRSTPGMTAGLRS